jgi:HMG (high mobility group) box
MWQAATEAEKAPYIALSDADKERYHAELTAYKLRYGFCHILVFVGEQTACLQIQ